MMEVIGIILCLHGCIYELLCQVGTGRLVPILAVIESVKDSKWTKNGIVYARRYESAHSHTVRITVVIVRTAQTCVDAVQEVLRYGFAVSLIFIIGEVHSYVSIYLVGYAKFQAVLGQ